MSETDIQRKRWEKYEDDIIREYYPTEGSETIARLPNRTKDAVIQRAKTLKIQYSIKGGNRSTRWTEDEDNIIREYFPTEGVGVKSRLSNRSVNAIRSRAQKLKIRLTNPRHNGGNLWTEDEDNIIKTYYSTEGSSVVSRLPHHSLQSIQKQASRLGVCRKRRIWTEEEDDIIRQYYPIEGFDVVRGLLPNRQLNSIRARIIKLGL